MKGKYSKFYEHFHYFLSKSPLMEENQAIFWQEKTENTKFSVQIEDKVFWKTSLRWVRTSANFYEVPWLIKIQRASADKVKIGSLTQNLSILGELIFLTQSAARVQLVLTPPRSLISGLRLKQFPKLFYSQNSRVRVGQKSVIR